MYQVLQYINDNIGNDLGLAQLARRFGYSKWYFCERFREELGTTVLGYIRTRRRAARRRLRRHGGGAAQV